RTGDPVRSDRIYVREYSAPAYHEIAWPDGCNSWDAPLLSHCASELFVLGQLWRDTQALPSVHNPKPPPSRGGGPVGLYRIRLPLCETELLREAHHKPDTKSDSGHWYFSRLLGLALDGTRLAVCVSMGKRLGDTTKWEYQIAMFDPATGDVEKCADLPAVF